MMFNNILAKLPELMKNNEPDLAQVLNPDLAQFNVIVTKPAIVKSVNAKLDTSYQSGVGLVNLLGTLSFVFKDDFTLTIKGKPNINIIVKKNLNITLTKQGATVIDGLLVDSIIDVPVRSAIIDGTDLLVKAGPITQRIALPKF